MTISFDNSNDVIVYALEKIISICRDHHHLYAAQCVWWLAAITGLQEGLVIHIDNLRAPRIPAITGSSNNPVTLESQFRDNIIERQHRILKE
jgi:hypothetical protein